MLGWRKKIIEQQLNLSRVYYMAHTGGQDEQMLTL